MRFTPMIPLSMPNTQAGSALSDAAMLMQRLMQFSGPQLPPAHARPGAARPGRFLPERFRNAAGERSYKLYIPASYRGEAVPLVVMLHGCSQSPDDFAAGTRMNEAADVIGCLVAYPAQNAQANMQRCWNWFQQADQHRGAGEPAIIAGITRDIMQTYAVDPDRVFVAGLSAGGAQAAIMADAYPDLYAAVGVHSGLACGAASDMSSAMMVMRMGAHASQRGKGAMEPTPILPTIVFHGDFDTTVHPSNSDEIIARLKAPGLRTQVERGRAAGGHGYTRTMTMDRAGIVVAEQWLISGGSHGWSGGSTAGSYTDPQGPDATREMLRFFLDHPRL